MVGLDKAKMGADKTIIDTDRENIGADKGIDNKNILYCFDGTSGQEKQQIILEFDLKKAQLISEEVYFDKEWHTLLILVGTLASNDSTVIQIYDVNNVSPNPTTAVFTEFFPKLKNATSIKVVRMNETWVLGFLASLDGEGGCIPLISLNSAKSKIVLQTGEKAKILNWVPVDTQFKGQVDKIYGLDEQGSLWLWSNTQLMTDIRVGSHIVVSPQELSQTLSQPPQKILDKKLNPQNITLGIVPSLDGNGEEIFYLGKTKEGKDELLSLNVLNESNFSNDAQLIKVTHSILSAPKITGEFQTFHIRFGRIVLIPKNHGLKPQVFSRTREGLKPLPSKWEISTHQNTPQAPRILQTPQDVFQSNLAKENRENALSPTSITHSSLVWDPKTNKELLFTLDSEHRLQIFESTFNSDKYARLSWKTFDNSTRLGINQ